MVRSMRKTKTLTLENVQTQRQNINIKLLRKVQEDIKAHPETLDMSEWCGTVQCIAAKAVILSGLNAVRENVKLFDVKHKAQELLGLSYDQAEQLFHVLAWDEEYRDRYLDADNDNDVNTKVAVTVEYIDHFVFTRSSTED
jgi:hypothetical protein